MEFIHNCKRFAGDLVLYHGTTTFLRHGDVSLIDTKTFKVTGIGELKTQHVSKDRLQISLTLLSKTPAKHVLKNIQMLERRAVDVPSKFTDRLNRQTARITMVLEDLPLPDRVFHLQLRNTAHLKELSEVLSDLESTRTSAKRVGDGLVLVGLTLPARKYSSLLFRFDATKVIAGKKTIIPAVHEIVDLKAANENAILVGTFQAMDPKRLGLLPGLMGLTPLFWWPIRIEFLEKLFFHKVTVLTLFNPLHIRRKFEAAGFTTTQNKRSHYFSLRKTVEGRELRVEGLHYWLRLITDHLFSENSVVDLIDRSIDGSIVKQLPQLGGCYIRPRIEQHF